MSRIAITGSRAHRTWKCPASAVLPQVDQADPSPARGKGTAIHAFLEVVGTIGVDEALARAPEELRPMLALIDVENLPTNCSTEVALAYDWETRTARELGRGIDRRYAEAVIALGAPLRRSETCMTLDILGANGKRGLVGDYKSGRTKYPPPDKYGQTLLGAIAARKAYGFTHVTVDLYYVGSDDGEHYTARRELDEWDLDTFEDEWCAAMKRTDEIEREIVGGYTPDVVEGSHCAHCPATKACPAKLALVARLPTEIDGLTRTGLPMTIERAAVAWVAIEKFEAMIDALKAEILVLGDVAPIELPDGRWIERVDSAKRGLNPKVAWEVIKDRYGDDAARAAAKVTISLEAAKAVVTANLKPGERATTKAGTGKWDELVRELDAYGGIELKRSSYVKAHVRKK